MKLSQVEWVPVGKAVYKEYTKDDVAGLSAEMAYWIVFSIFPFFIFLATVAGLIGQAIGVTNILDNITKSLYSALDGPTAETLRGVLETILTPAGGALSFGALFSAVLALNSASTAIATMMKAFNRAYGVEETRNFLVAKLVAIGLTLVLVLLLIGGSILLTGGGAIVRALGLGAIGGFFLRALTIIGALAGIGVGLSIMYWKGPNVKQSFVWVSPGSLIATIALALFSAAFGLYVTFVAGASFSKTYGALAGVILFLFFLRFASLIILLGAEFNAETARRYDPETIRDKVTDPKKQLPTKQGKPHPQAAREAGVTPQQVAASQRRAAGKLDGGVRGPELANAPLAAAVEDDDPGYSHEDVGEGGDEFANPTLDKRLRELRERPFVSELERVRAEKAFTSSEERQQRAKTAFVTLGVAAVAAIGAVVNGVFRRNAV